MVRVVIRPWPRSTCRWVIGVSVQGSASSAANRPGWLCLTRKHEPCAALVQVGGVVALAVQRVGGDHQSAQVDADGGELLEQRGEHRDLVGLRADLDLTEDQLVAVGGRGQQVHLVAVGVDCTADGLRVRREIT